MHYYDLPSGLFQMLISIWESVLETFIEIYAFLGDLSVQMESGPVSVISLLLGSGLVLYLGAVVVRWVKQLFLA